VYYRGSVVTGPAPTLVFNLAVVLPLRPACFVSPRTPTSKGYKSAAGAVAHRRAARLQSSVHLFRRSRLPRRVAALPLRRASCADVVSRSSNALILSEAVRRTGRCVSTRRSGSGRSSRSAPFPTTSRPLSRVSPEIRRAAHRYPLEIMFRHVGSPRVDPSSFYTARARRRIPVDYF